MCFLVFFFLVLSEKSILLQSGLQLSSIRPGNWLSHHWHLTGCLFSRYNNCQLSTNLSSHRNNEGQSWWTMHAVASLAVFLYSHLISVIPSFSNKEINKENYCKMLSLRVGQQEDMYLCVFFSSWVLKPLPKEKGWNISVGSLFFFFFCFKKALQLQDKM